MELQIVLVLLIHLKVSASLYWASRSPLPSFFVSVVLHEIARGRLQVLVQNQMNLTPIAQEFRVLRLSVSSLKGGLLTSCFSKKRMRSCLDGKCVPVFIFDIAKYG